MSGWWKQLATSVSSVASSVTGPSNFPFREGQFKLQLGPFRVFEGVNSGMPEGSEFSKVCIWRAQGKDQTAIRIVKEMRTLQHPSMLKALVVKEQKDEILIVTEYCVLLREWPHGDEPEWREWAGWQLKGVEKWLDDSKLDANDRTILTTQSGECRLVLCKAGLDKFNGAFTESSCKSKLIALSEDLMFLPTMNPAQQISFYSRVLAEELPGYVRKHLLLPKCVSFRKTLLTMAAPLQPVSLEEVKLLFGEASLRVCGGEADFMALLAEICVELFNGRVPLTDSTLVLFIKLLSGWTGGMSEAWISAQLMPQLGKLFTTPNAQLRMAVLAVLKSAIPGLPVKLLSGEGLRLLARGQNDQDPAIRLESFTILGLVMDRLPGDLKAKVSGPALCKGLSDPAGQCRMAALRVLAGWSEWILEVDEVAGRIGPVLLTIAAKGTSREEVNAAINSIEKVILPRLRKRASSISQIARRSEVSYTAAADPDTEEVVKTTGKLSLNSSNNRSSTLPAILTPATPADEPISLQKPSKMRLGSIKKVT